MTDLVLKWGDLGASGTSIASAAPNAVSATLETSDIAVDVTFTAQDASAAAETSDATGYVAAGETFDANSHLKLTADSADDGLSNTSTTVLDFRAKDTTAFSNEVENVTFRISDVDQGDGAAGDEGQVAGISFEDIVTIRAYDASGNLLTVDLTAGSSVLVSDDTATGTTTTGFADASSSVLVSIPGPVSKIEIDYDNGGEAHQALLVGDIQFSSVEWHVDDENCPPVAVDDLSSTEMDEAKDVDVLVNDYDPDGDQIFLVDGSAENGSVKVNDDGTLTYTPNAGYIGKDNITYTIRDEHGATATGNVEMHVETVGNTGPVANDDSAETDAGQSVTIPIFANDSDADGDTLTITSISDSPGGWYEIVNGELVYTPDDGFTGTDSFTYEVTDGNGGYDTATITINVGGGNTGDNNAPVANPDAVEVEVNTTATLTNLLDNDFDVDGDTLTITEIGTPTYGTAVLNDDGTVSYTPNTDYEGVDAFSYTISDGNGGTATSTVCVHIAGDGGNQAPVTVDDAITTDEDTAVLIPNPSANDSDPDGDTVTMQAITQPSNGTAVLNDDGTITYTPAENFNGSDELTYFVGDGNGGLSSGKVVITVNPVNDDPDAINDTISTDVNNSVTIPVLNNDTDVDGDTLTITEVSDASNGNAIIQGNQILYTPVDGFTGSDSFTYTISDGNGGTDTATVTVNVQGVGGNSAPVAVEDTITTDEDTEVVIPNPAANDTDADGDTLTVQSVGTPANGTAQLNDDGTVTYTPNPNFNGTDTITYVVSDGSTTSNGTITVTVNPVNDDPEADNDTLSTPVNQVASINVLDNDDDVDGDTLTVTGVSTPTNGTVSFTADGVVTFTPATDFTGTEVLTYDITDGNGGTDTATLTIYVGTGTAPDGIIDGTNGDDSIDDTYTGDPDTPPDMVDNNDAILPGTSGDDDSIRAGDGNDTVIAGEGSDTVDGGDDNDVIDTGGSNPAIDADVFPLDPSQQALDPLNGLDEDTDPNDDKDSVFGGNGNDTIRTGDDDDTIDGGAGDDVIEGGIDDDSILGGDGNDSITDVQGSDTVYGGQGNDTIEVGIDVYSDYVGDDPNLPILGFTSDPNKDDNRDFVDGGAGNDVIVTGDDSDTIIGGTGNDTIDAGIDDDSVEGGDGADSILAGHGSDVVLGGAGNDYIDGSNPASLEITDDVDPVTNNDRDLLDGGDGNDTLIGGDDDDTLSGGAGNDSLDGGIDEDSLSGGAGNDTLIGGQGADTIFGGDGQDVILGATGGDVVDGGDGPAGTAPNGLPNDYDTLDLRGSAPAGGSINIIYTSDDREDGIVEFFDDTRTDGSSPISTMTFEEIENVIPCFTPGTMIATAMGERKVEDLQPGDRVITRDNGIQTLSWVGRKDLTAEELERAPHLRPILISKGALGNGLPETDLLVSPNHRVLVSNDKTALYFEEREVLVAAKHLIGLPGVTEVEADGIGYIHVMFDRHEVILSNGAWTESFQPGDYSLKGIGNAQRNEILELFPELATDTGLEAYRSARRSLKRHEAALLVG